MILKQHVLKLMQMSSLKWFKACLEEFMNENSISINNCCQARKFRNISQFLTHIFSIVAYALWIPIVSVAGKLICSFDGFR